MTPYVCGLMRRLAYIRRHRRAWWMLRQALEETLPEGRPPRLVVLHQYTRRVRPVLRMPPAHRCYYIRRKRRAHGGVRHG